MITISKEYLQGITGGHGENKPPIDGCMFSAIAKAGRIVDAELPSGSHSDAARQRRFLELRDRFDAECRKSKRAG